MPSPPPAPTPPDQPVVPARRSAGSRGQTRQLRRWGPWVLGIVVLAACLPVGCIQRGSATATATPRGEGAEPAPREPYAALPEPTTGMLTQEPQIGVFLRAGAQLRFTTLVAGTLDGMPVEAGSHLAQAEGGSVVLDGERVGSESAIALEAGTGTRFRTEVLPPTGAPQILSLAGEPVLHLAGGVVELIERVGLETYLAGVVTSEMSPAWPQAALEAQAVAARSYACAKYLTHQNQPWQLHWHYTVDMAYAGAHARRSPASQAALEATRGEVLMYQGAPVPALFSACSGGRSESASDIFGQLRGANGVDMTPVMPVVDDPAAQDGAEQLGMADTHGHWQAELPFYQITLGLKRYAQEHPERHIPAGSVIAVRLGGYFTASGRVARVLITLQHGEHRRIIALPATDFRMAVGPGVVRSTWWNQVVVHAHGLTIHGLGFGHGVGLSQVSAWYLAHSGESSTTILGRFYRGAELVRAYP